MLLRQISLEVQVTSLCNRRPLIVKHSLELEVGAMYLSLESCYNLAAS